MVPRPDGPSAMSSLVLSGVLEYFFGNAVWGCSLKLTKVCSSAVVSLSALAIGLVWTTIQTPVWAQVLYGSMVGTVTDPGNAVVPKASVTVKNDATGLTRQATA